MAEAHKVQEHIQQAERLKGIEITEHLGNRHGHNHRRQVIQCSEDSRAFRDIGEQ
ncbi:hypothetical protein D3C72_2510120 [compost metagenome]